MVPSLAQPQNYLACIKNANFWPYLQYRLPGGKTLESPFKKTIGNFYMAVGKVKSYNHFGELFGSSLSRHM